MIFCVLWLWNLNVNATLMLCIARYMYQNQVFSKWMVDGGRGPSGVKGLAGRRRRGAWRRGGDAGGGVGRTAVRARRRRRLVVCRRTDSPAARDRSLCLLSDALHYSCSRCTRAYSMINAVSSQWSPSALWSVSAVHGALDPRRKGVIRPRSPRAHAARPWRLRPAARSTPAKRT